MQIDVDHYLAYLTAQQRSAHTVAAVGFDLQTLLQYTHKIACERWTLLTPRDIKGFIAQQVRAGLKPTTVARQLSSVRGLYKYLIAQNQAEHNPAQGVRTPKKAQRLPKALDIEPSVQLMAIENLDDHSPLALRDKAILELFYSSGLRLTELRLLTLEDYQAASGLVRVLGKGRKVREVPVGTQAQTALAAWLVARQGWLKTPDNSLCQHIFTGIKGTPLTARAIEYRIAYWAVRLGLPQHVHPHMLRHSMASHVLQSAQDLRAVQELLGHKNLSTTQIYTKLDFQHLAKVYERAHPLA